MTLDPARRDRRRDHASPARLPRTLALVLVITAPGCEGCEDRPPVVPFQISSGAAASASASSAPPSSDPTAAPSRFAVVRGQKAPGDGKQWGVGKRSLSAPTGRRFDTGLVVDATGSGHADLLAWTRGKKEEADGLWFASGSPEAPEGVELGAATSAPDEEEGCEVTRETTQIGPRTVLFERRVTCEAGHAGAVWAGIVRLSEGGSIHGPPSLLLTLHARPPSKTLGLELAFDAADRDGDGRDDLAVLLTARGDLEPFEGAPSLEAKLTYFDRPAGLSRDPAEPRRSLEAHARRLEKDSRSRERAKEVTAAARQLEHLERALCDELGSPSLFVQGRGVACGDGTLSDDAIRASGSAALTLGDALAAMGHEARLRAVAGDKSKDLVKLSQELDKAVPARAARIAHRLVARPVKQTGGGVVPFAFEGDALYVTALSGVVRVDLASFAEEAIDMPGWGPRLSSQKLSPPPPPPAAPPEGEEPPAPPPPPPSPPAPPELVVLAVDQRCEPPFHVASLSDSGGRHEVPLPILGWMGADGRSARRCEPLTIPVLGFGADAQGAAFAVGLQAVDVRMAESGPVAAAIEVPGGLTRAAVGGAASPDHAVAVPRGDEVVVLRKGGAERWGDAELKAPEDCAVAEGARFVACRAGGLGVILTLR